MGNLFPIIFEDDDLLVIDKPAGIEVTSGPSGNKSIEKLVDIKIERGGIVHRLDKDTSGVLIIAKTNKAFGALKQQFHDHAVHKIYTALVAGLTPPNGEIDAFISRDPKRKQAMKAVTYATGLERGEPREAKTIYKMVQEFKVGDSTASLLDIEIETGRTHQIRVHMQSIGHPILGDKMYFTKESKQLSNLLKIDRQFLHAKEITLHHPTNKKTIVFKSVLPADLNNIISYMRSLSNSG